PWVVEQTKRLIDEVKREGIDVPFTILNRTAAECDCARCREQAKRDASARRELAPSFDAQRSCLPLDSASNIEQWLRGAPHPVPLRGTDLSPRERLKGGGTSPAGRGRREAAGEGPRTRVLFLAGKGGVGKTTCASSIALQLAQRGKTTLLSVDPAHSVRDVFAREKPPANL